MPQTQRDILDEFLEDNPNLLFQAHRPQTTSPGFGGGFLDYWRGRQGDVYNEYLGDIGRTALRGETPTGSFTSFLSNYDFRDRFSAQSPRERGNRIGSFAPRLRYNL
jgi:hypothetical protein